MKRTIIFAALFSMALFTNAQTKIIYDTDFGGDADDLGALSMLNYFHNNKECELLAVMSWTTEEYTVPAMDAVNTYYGNPDIPIGVRKTSKHHAEWNYGKPIADKFKHNLTYETAPDAVKLYRKILSEQDNHSIVLVTVGPLANIQNLINSTADEYSELNGKELLHKKVKELVIMGGQFPEGQKEWNFDGDMKGVTKFVIENIDLPVVFSGFEVGVAIKSGEVFNEIDKNTPLYIGFMHFSKHAPWMKQDYKGKILDNSTFDQTAVLYAVRGLENMWSLQQNGRCIPDDVGGNRWEITNKKTNHAYMKLEIEPEKAASYMEDLMLHNEGK